MKIPIAREGRGIVFGAVTFSLSLLYLGNRTLKKVAVAALGASAGLAMFFRDPERFIVPIEDGILAPADGEVIRIDTVDAKEFFKEPVRRISIFMSLKDCHVNRAPVSGKVSYKSKKDGTFLAAWDDRASEENRRAWLGISGDTPALCKQVAGLCARQIVTYPEVGDEVTQGERIGIIMFGSRVDVLFSTDLRLLINVGDRTIAGVTGLAERAR